MSTMLSTVPGDAFALTRSMRWTLARWPGLRREITIAAPAAEATQLAAGAYKGHLARDVIADPEVPVGGMAAITDGDPVARDAAGAHRPRVGLLLDRVRSHPGGPAPPVVTDTLSNR